MYYHITITILITAIIIAPTVITIILAWSSLHGTPLRRVHVPGYRSESRPEMFTHHPDYAQIVAIKIQMETDYAFLLRASRLRRIISSQAFSDSWYTAPSYGAAAGNSPFF